MNDPTKSSVAARIRDTVSDVITRSQVPTVIYGTVQAIAPDGTTLNVIQVGSTTITPGLKYIDSYNPAVGDTVVLCLVGTDLWVLGSLGVNRLSWTAYTPTWAATVNPPVLGNATLTGQYQLVGKTCHVQIRLVIPTTWTGSGGSGNYRFGLPIPIGSGTFLVQTFWVKFYNGSAGVNVLGFGNAVVNGVDVTPWLPIRNPTGNYDLAGMCNELTSGGGAGTAVPYLGGTIYPLPSTGGGDLYIEGTYSIN